MNGQNYTDYDIKMKTPIGIRSGHIKVYQNPGTVSGYLDILNHNEPFEGTIDTDGNCKLFGKIITLMRTINYEAEGKITADSISLSITDERYVLEITGTACR